VKIELLTVLACRCLSIDGVPIDGLPDERLAALCVGPQVRACIPPSM
jgi:hypothetical protein